MKAIQVPDKYRLRTLEFSDYEAVMRLWQTTEGMGLSNSDEAPAIETFLQRNPGLSRVVVDAKGAVVGALLCGHDGRRGFLYHLAVAQAHRKLGLGHALVESCMDGLRTLGVAKCSLFLIANNSEGRQFWLREGWKPREDLVIIQQPL